MKGIKPGSTVRTPTGKLARVVRFTEAGYRALLEYIPDIPVFGAGPGERVELPVRLLVVT